MAVNITELINRSRAAQQVLEGFSQHELDTVVHMLAKVVFDNAEPLARLAADESRMGVYKDKIAKNMGKSRIIWDRIKDKKSRGVIAEYPDEGIIEVAKPMGVVAAVTPCTNPVVTPMCNAMFAIKCANSIIIAPHPRGKKVALRLEELYHAELKKLGVPEDVFLVIAEPTIELTGELMHAADVVIATGGGGMVKAAYSSGKPAFGVGPGNVQCIFDRGIDIASTVEKVITGRTFDNGIICSGEQTVIAPAEQLDDIIAAFTSKGALYLDKAEDVDKIRKAVFPGGTINKDVVGQSTRRVLELAGIEHEGDVRVILVKPEAFGSGDCLSKEKMCPLMCVYHYESFEDAVEIAYQNLCVEGKGHSASIHSEDMEHVKYAAGKLPVSRLVVNQISSTMTGGSFSNGLNPTTTLGCGSWGNNSISENLTYYHLMNRSRISTVKPNWSQPSDEDIWKWE